MHTKGPFMADTPLPTAPALLAAASALFDALRMVELAPRTHPERDGASYWAILLTPRQLDTIRAALDAAADADATDDDTTKQRIAQLEQRRAALFDAELWKQDLELYAELLALKARYQKGN